MAARPFFSVKAFFGKEDGALIIFALFLFVLMATMGGIALDLMKYETTRTELSQTLDRCTLMAATMEQRLDPQSVVEDCVTKAGLGDKLRTVTVLNSMNGRDVHATAQADTKPFFMHMIGINSFDAKAGSRAVQTITNVEIVLVLDVSGSMSGTKIANLRTAASRFVATMIDGDPNRRVSIAVVPYNAQVNLGPVLRSKFNATDVHNVTDVNCLELPSAAFAQTGIPRTMPLPMMAWSDHYYGTNTVGRLCLADRYALRAPRHPQQLLPPDPGERGAHAQPEQDAAAIQHQRAGGGGQYLDRAGHEVGRCPAGSGGPVDL